MRALRTKRIKNSKMGPSEPRPWRLPCRAHTAGSGHRSQGLASSGVWCCLRTIGALRGASKAVAVPVGLLNRARFSFCRVRGGNDLDVDLVPTGTPRKPASRPSLCPCSDMLEDGTLLHTASGGTRVPQGTLRETQAQHRSATKSFKDQHSVMS